MEIQVLTGNALGEPDAMLSTMERLIIMPPAP